jgi:hypothetical protein
MQQPAHQLVGILAKLAGIGMAQGLCQSLPQFVERKCGLTHFTYRNLACHQDAGLSLAVSRTFYCQCDAEDHSTKTSSPAVLPPGCWASAFRVIT